MAAEWRAFHELLFGRSGVLTVARNDTTAYVPAPPGGVRNYLLPHPELYDLSNDPDESYDVAPKYPDVVAKMQAKIGEMITKFPEPVQRAWADSKSRQADPSTPVGAWPRPAAPN